MVPIPSRVPSLARGAAEHTHGREGRTVRRLTMLCLVAGSFIPQSAVAMGRPLLPELPDSSRFKVPPQIVQPPPEKPVPTEKKTETLRTVRLVILGSVACTGLLVLVRLRTRQPVGSGDESVRRTPVARILPSRRQGRVLQLDPPARHAPETSR